MATNIYKENQLKNPLTILSLIGWKFAKTKLIWWKIQKHKKLQKKQIPNTKEFLSTMSGDAVAWAKCSSEQSSQSIENGPKTELCKIAE